MEVIPLHDYVFTRYRNIERKKKQDWGDISNIVLFGKRKYNIETFVLCDVYYTNTGYSIKTKPLLDLQKSFYSLAEVNTLPENSLADSLLFHICRTTIESSNNLNNTLLNKKKLNPRIVKKEHKKSAKNLEKKKNAIYKEFWKHYKQEVRKSKM